MTAILQVRLDKSLKMGAENAFKDMGLSMSDGIRSYLTYVNLERKLPFEPKADPWRAHNESDHIPNAETARALQDATDGKNLTRVTREELSALWNLK